MDTPTNASVPGSASVQKNVLMAILAYIGPLIIVSYLVARGDPFVKFHIKQGLVLIVIQIVVWVLRPVFWPSWVLLINLAVLILAIIGIVNAAQGNEKQLPLVGRYAAQFQF